MKQLLESNGWAMYYSCNCPSGRKEYYSHAEKKGFEVRCRVKSGTFSILKDNMVVAGPFWGYQLEEKLKQYVDQE